MHWDWKDWLALSSLIAVFYGGVSWIYKRIKELIKFIEGLEKDREEIERNRKRIEFLSAKIDGVIMLLNEAFFVCNEDGLCVLSNDYLCNLFEATHEQMAGTGWGNFIVAEDRDAAWERWIKGIRSGVKYMSDSYRIAQGRSKKIIKIEYHATIYRDDKEEVVIVSVGKAFEAKASI